MARTFNPDGSPATLQLMDLATYGNFVNNKGATAAFTGDHQVKNLENDEKGNVLLNDHKKG
jgi:hypothetical protein